MNLFYPFENTPLPYAYDALEPYIDTETMRLHHDKHLQAYVDNLNGVLQNASFLQSKNLDWLVRHWRTLPQALQTPVRNNAGGVYNHRFYFEGLSPADQTEQADSLLLEKIQKQFGSLEAFKKCFKEKALGVFGSGYTWLVLDRGRLCITSTANQDTPLAQGQCPLLTLDVWEHAYYLKHHNLRKDYIDDWFCVVNWKKADKRLQAVL